LLRACLVLRIDSTLIFPIQQSHRVGLVIWFKPTIRFGFSVYKYFGFPATSNRSVLKENKNRRVRFRFLPNNIELRSVVACQPVVGPQFSDGCRQPAACRCAACWAPGAAILPPTSPAAARRRSSRGPVCAGCALVPTCQALRACAVEVCLPGVVEGSHHPSRHRCEAEAPSSAGDAAAWPLTSRFVCRRLQCLEGRNEGWGLNQLGI
jgi:hypothetical protein